MTCIIIDDEPDAIAAVKKYLQKIPEIALCFETTDPLEGLAFLKNNVVDFIFLDINMEGLGGLDLARIVNNRIIVTTAHSEHAVTSYEYPNIIDYLMKPIEYERLVKAIQKMKTVLAVGQEQPGQYIEIKVARGIVRMDCDMIEFIEADRTISMINGKDAIPIPLGELEILLKEKRFMRVHKSYIVNEAKIASIRYNKVQLSSGKLVPIGRRYQLPA